MNFRRYIHISCGSVRPRSHSGRASAVLISDKAAPYTIFLFVVFLKYQRERERPISGSIVLGYDRTEREAVVSTLQI